MAGQYRQAARAGERGRRGCADPVSKADRRNARTARGPGGKAERYPERAIRGLGRYQDRRRQGMGRYVKGHAGRLETYDVKQAGGVVLRAAPGDDNAQTPYQRLSASSSSSLAATQPSEPPATSFFQNGARDLR